MASRKKRHDALPVWDQHRTSFSVREVPDFLMMTMGYRTSLQNVRNWIKRGVWVPEHNALRYLPSYMLGKTRFVDKDVLLDYMKKCLRRKTP